MITLLEFIDYLGTIVFSYIGTNISIEKGKGYLLSIMFGFITSVGGGTIRDFLLGNPIFWIKERKYIIISVLASLFAFFNHSNSNFMFMN